MDYLNLRAGTINAGFGASAGVYVHLHELEPMASVTLAIVAFICFHDAISAIQNAINNAVGR